MMIARLHVITQAVDGTSHVDSAEQACEAGARWIQLRMKNTPHDEWFRIAAETQQVCRRWKATFIVNDNVAMAKELNADGVHLGKEDMSPREARAVLGESAVIGGTANTIEDIRRLASEGVNYVGVGPFRFTTTKERLSPILGVEGLSDIVRYCKSEGIRIPLIAIGGITVDDVVTLRTIGVHGVAVSSAIATAQNKERIISQVQAMLDAPYSLEPDR